MYFLQGRYEDCQQVIVQLGDSHPENWAWNAACYAYLGDQDGVQRETERFLRDYSAYWAGDPAAGLADYIRWILDLGHPFSRAEDRAHLAEGFRRAGLPV